MIYDEIPINLVGSTQVAQLKSAVFFPNGFDPLRSFAVLLFGHF